MGKLDMPEQGHGNGGMWICKLREWRDKLKSTRKLLRERHVGKRPASCPSALDSAKISSKKGTWFLKTFGFHQELGTWCAITDFEKKRCSEASYPNGGSKPFRAASTCAWCHWETMIRCSDFLMKKMVSMGFENLSEVNWFLISLFRLSCTPAGLRAQFIIRKIDDAGRAHRRFILSIGQRRWHARLRVFNLSWPTTLD